MLHHDGIPYAGESLIVHNNIVFNIKFYFIEISYANTKNSHNYWSSSISGCKKMLIFTFGFCELGIIKIKNIYGDAMHIYKEKLYGISIITNQHEYCDAW